MPEPENEHEEVPRSVTDRIMSMIAEGTAHTPKAVFIVIVDDTGTPGLTGAMREEGEWIPYSGEAVLFYLATLVDTYRAKEEERGSGMAAFYVFPECESGAHDTCPRFIQAPEGVLGGALCACEHHKEEERADQDHRD